MATNVDDGCRSAIRPQCALAYSLLASRGCPFSSVITSCDSTSAREMTTSRRDLYWATRAV